MTYTFHGSICGSLCPGIDEPVTDATIRLYRVDDTDPERHAAHVAAQPRETAGIIDEDRVEAKAKRHLTDAEIKDDGTYSVTLSKEDHDYGGGPFEVDIRVHDVPGRTAGDEGPVQATIRTFDRAWGKDLDLQWDYCFSRSLWCSIRSRFGARVICGQVTFCDTQEPVNDVTVRAFDADIVEDDPLGTAVTAGAGYFVIYYTREDYVRTPLSPFLNVELEHGPDVYVTVEASDGTPLLEEPRSKGRETGREDLGVCAHLTDVCIPADDTGTGEDLTTTLWTGVGAAFDVPTDFTTDGYAVAGAREFALTGVVNLTGSTPLRNADGNPVQYRFRVSDATAPNSDPAIPAADFDRTPAPDDHRGPIGVGDNADLFDGTTIGKAMVLESGTGRLIPIEVTVRRSDLDADGWITPDSVLNRALTDAGYTRTDLRYWDDVDTLLALDTGGLAPRESSPPDPAAGQSVDTATDGFPVHRYALRFEARDAATGAATPGSGQTMNRLVFDNNPTVRAIDLKTTSSGDPCDPVTGGVAVAYTAYHPHIDWVRLYRQRNEGSEAEIEDDDSDTTKAPLVQDTAGGPVQVYSYDGTGDLDDVSNHFDITPSSTCTYIVWMRTRRRLHTGGSQVSASRTRLIPFYFEA